jgi:hypothetical protein
MFNEIDLPRSTASTLLTSEIIWHLCDARSHLYLVFIEMFILATHDDLGEGVRHLLGPNSPHLTPP